MITLLNPTRQTIPNPSEHDVRSALSGVIADPEGANGYTSIQLKQDNGWMLTAYGCELVILEHENAAEHVPSHLADLKQEDVEEILVRFLQPDDNLSDLGWEIGYGPA